MKRRDFMTLLALVPTMGYAKWQGASQTPSPLLGYLRTNWSQDPFSYGSYSYIAKGSGTRDLKAVLKPIDDKIFFAGEALNTDYQSTVHAAHESGREQAEYIISYLNKAKLDNIAIIGAGMSGLTAAKVLADNGANIKVFEARDRIGGRIWTDRSLGKAVDLGATWIHGADGNPITDLANQAGQQRFETDDKYIIRGRDGKLLAWRDVKWLESLEIQTEAGADPDLLNYFHYSSKSLFRSNPHGYGGAEEAFIDGYDKILTVLAGDYDIQLSSIVERVALKGNKVDIDVANKKAESFDAVIITVPLGVLKQNKIRFEPPLSEKKQNAIKRMGMGTLDKLYLHFEDAFWDEDVTWIYTPENGLPRGQFNMFVNFQRFLGVPIIMGFNGGSAALAVSNLSDETVVSHALETLHTAYP